MANLGYIAILVYIAITVAMMLTPKNKLEALLKLDFGITKTYWKKTDTKLGYYRILVLVAGMLTVIILLLTCALLNFVS